MNYLSEKEELENILSDINKSLVDNTTNDEVVRKINNLKDDIRNDFFTIVVLGEFKRGKSTFINALLGEKVLPADVTPTTATINALMWDEKRKTEVLKNDGSRDKGESTLEFLSNYTASAEFDVDNIKYLKVGYDSQLLRNNLVIVDTPGVSDINEQRVQVTYDFIPRADAVIFLLDATSPLKRTEKEFIQEHIIKIGIDKVLFIANRFDNIDEEEEEEVLDDIKLRLRRAFTREDKLLFNNLKVIPMSSRLALEGVEDSGLNLVKEEIDNIMLEGSKGEEKVRRYRRRIYNILTYLNTELLNERNMFNSSLEELNSTLLRINNMLCNEEDRKYKINRYIQQQKEDIIFMIRKSINFMHTNLADEINDSIEMYKGVDFKDYVEKNITTLIKKNFTRWVNMYAPAIDKMIIQLQKEVGSGLARYFRTSINIDDNDKLNDIEGNYVNYKAIINIEAQDISNITTKAGLISAGAAGLVTLIGGPIILPFISMAAFPVLQKNMLNNKLREAKDEIKPQLNSALNQSIDQLIYEIEKSVSDRIDEISIKIEEKFVQLFDDIREKVEWQINSRKDSISNIQDKVKEIDFKLECIKNLLERISD